MRRRIFWSTLSIATVALLLTAVLVAVIGQAIVSQQTRNEMRRQAVAAESILVDELQETGSVARLFAAILAPGTTDDVAGARQNLERLAETARRLLGAEFFDVAFVTPAGEIVLLIDRRPDPFGFDPALISTGADQFTRTAGDGGRRVLAYARPITRPSQESGPRLAVVVARQSAVLDFGAVVRSMAFVLLLTVALSAVAARVVSKRMGRGLDELAGAARALAAGNMAVRAQIGDDSEIADLAATFNRTADQLAEAQARERSFLMSVGHELRTPLTTIAGYAEMLEEGDVGRDETARIAAVLSGETERLRRLVEDLMMLARLEAHEFTLNHEDVDVGAHVAEMAEGFRHRAEAARVSLRTEIDSALLHTDPDRVEQIAANLLENALRYTPEAGIAMLSVSPEAGGVSIRVSDTGSGIDAEDLPHVFDKFYVARKYRRLRPEGSGLGLSIVKELVDALGGRINATSTDSGTTIEVFIPSAAR